MWLAGLVKNTIKGGNGGSGGSLLVRYMSRSRAVNVRKINPKVPIEEAKSIAGSLYELIKQRGPLTTPNTWSAAQYCIYYKRLLSFRSHAVVDGFYLDLVYQDCIAFIVSSDRKLVSVD